MLQICHVHQGSSDETKQRRTTIIGGVGNVETRKDSVLRFVTPRITDTLRLTFQFLFVGSIGP